MKPKMKRKAWEVVVELGCGALVVGMIVVMLALVSERAKGAETTPRAKPSAEQVGRMLAVHRDEMRQFEACWKAGDDAGVVAAYETIKADGAGFPAFCALRGISAYGRLGREDAAMKEVAGLRDYLVKYPRSAEGMRAVVRVMTAGGEFTRAVAEALATL